jgi:hypothetical protein
MMAEAPKPSAIAGRISDRQSAARATAGTRLRWTEKMSRSMIPSQNDGIETPAAAIAMVRLSIQVPRLTAAMTPRENPTAIATPKLAAASWTV